MKLSSGAVLIILVSVTAYLCFVLYMGAGKSGAFSVSKIRQGLDLQGGVSIVYAAGKQNPTSDEMDAAASMIQQRLDRKNYTEAEVAREGAARLRVDIPGVDDAEAAVKEIGQTAVLRFIDGDGKVVVTGSQVADAKRTMYTARQDAAPENAVSLRLTSDGAVAFAEATRANRGKPIYILMDESILSAPMVNSVITDGNAVITGSFTPESAEELAALIRAGSLPFSLDVIYMNNIGAKLGADALSTSVLAGSIGLALVLIFMLLVYRVLGVCADLALVIYICLTLLVLSGARVTMTLPGIAGIILSVGMAVDANVIIFERIREELSLGKILKAAVEAGFKRAFPAIFDGNVTTLIATVVLFNLGSGPVRGFAQTLAIGVLVSMFTAIVVTKMIIKAFVGVGVNNPALYGKQMRIGGASQ
ncbi:MAG: protein translocase subunit SecD [Clostridiales bacterium]|nr:protein translocase subunit SecD [Clostridiales bacterium]